jgi:hypothetical protein
VFLSILRLILCRLFPRLDEEATSSGIIVGPTSFEFQLEGKTLLSDREKLPIGLTSSRPGCVHHFAPSATKRTLTKS